MPTGRADDPCRNTDDGEHRWYYNAVVGMQCNACAASRPHDPERDGPVPQQMRRRGTRRERSTTAPSPRRRESIFADRDQQPERHRDIRVAGRKLSRRSDPGTSRESGHAVATQADTWRARCLEILIREPGLCAGVYEQKLGKHGVWRRFPELVRDGFAYYEGRMTNPLTGRSQQRIWPVRADAQA